MTQKNDYSSEPDYYTQGFEKEGVVSVWVGLRDDTDQPDADVLQDLCGIGYYELSYQEGRNFDFELVELGKLLEDLCIPLRILMLLLLRPESEESTRHDG